MAGNLGPIHCLYAAKAVPMNGAPSSNADEAAFRRSAGKCAGPIPAKNCANAQNNLRPQVYQNTDEQLFSARSAIFC
jgi:hypothetical protein